MVSLRDLLTLLVKRVFIFFDELLGEKWGIKIINENIIGSFFYFVTSCTIKIDLKCNDLVFRGQYIKSVFNFSNTYKEDCVHQIITQRQAEQSVQN